MEIVWADKAKSNLPGYWGNIQVNKVGLWEYEHATERLLIVAKKWEPAWFYTQWTEPQQSHW